MKISNNNSIEVRVFSKIYDESMIGVKIYLIIDHDNGTFSIENQKPTIGYGPMYVRDVASVCEIQFIIQPFESLDRNIAIADCIKEALNYVNTIEYFSLIT
jgi:hypothetical protein